MKEYLVSFLDHIYNYKRIYIYNFIGLCFLVLVFFFRVIFERLSKNLETFYMALFIISFFLMLLHVIIVIIQLNDLFFKKNKKTVKFYHLWRISKIILWKKILKPLQKDDKKKNKGIYKKLFFTNRNSTKLCIFIISFKFF